jgi:hypothetical protein
MVTPKFGENLIRYVYIGKSNIFLIEKNQVVRRSLNASLLRDLGWNILLGRLQLSLLFNFVVLRNIISL